MADEHRCISGNMDKDQICYECGKSAMETAMDKGTKEILKTLEKEMTDKIPEEIYIVTGDKKTGGYWSLKQINLKRQKMGSLAAYIRKDKTITIEDLESMRRTAQELYLADKDMEMEQSVYTADGYNQAIKDVQNKLKGAGE